MKQILTLIFATVLLQVHAQDPFPPMKEIDKKLKAINYNFSSLIIGDTIIERKGDIISFSIGKPLIDGWYKIGDSLPLSYYSKKITFEREKHTGTGHVMQSLNESLNDLGVTLSNLDLAFDSLKLNEALQQAAKALETLDTALLNKNIREANIAINGANKALLSITEKDTTKKCETGLIQGVKIDDDVTEVKIGSWRMIIKEDPTDPHKKTFTFNSKNEADSIAEKSDSTGRYSKNFSTKWFKLDLGINTMLNDGGTKLPAEYENLELNLGKSINVNLHIFQQRVKLFVPQLSLNYGLSIAWNNYRFSRDITLLPRQDALTITESDINFKKNKLTTSYLTIPLIFRWNTFKWDAEDKEYNRRLHLGIGGFGGYLLNAHTKQVSSEEGKTKIADDFNLDKLRYGLRGEIGYRGFRIYSDYALSDLFENGEGPKLNTISAGFMVLF